MRSPKYLVLYLLLILFSACQPATKPDQADAQVKISASYEDLLDLFERWRSFETPPMSDGAPDYTAATFAARWPDFKELQTELLSMDTSRMAPGLGRNERIRF